MSRLLIFGGTTEGRLLAQALSQRGVSAAVSVATELGAEELSGLPGITPLAGRKTAEEMAVLLAGFDKCVDATHPYAREVSANIRSACRSAGVPLRRLLRRESQLPAGSILAGSPEEAAQFLQGQEGNILLAIGAKGLSAFSGLDPARLYPRVLPVEESLSACRRAGVPTPPGAAGGGKSIRLPPGGGPHQKHHRHARPLLPNTQRGHSGAVPHPLDGHQGRRLRRGVRGESLRGPEHRGLPGGYWTAGG